MHSIWLHSIPLHVALHMLPAAPTAGLYNKRGRAIPTLEWWRQLMQLLGAPPKKTQGHSRHNELCTSTSAYSSTLSVKVNLNQQ